MLLIELGVQICQPLDMVRSWNFPGGWLPRKLPRIMNESPGANVLLTGSSLFLYPAVRCDESLSKQRSRFDRYYVETVIDPYGEANYFRVSLNSRLGKQLTVVNCASAGSLMSDQYLVLKNWLKQKRRPEFLVSDISPREFIDNKLQAFENTPVCKVLTDRFSIWEIFQANAAANGGWNQLFKPSSSFYRDRNEYKLALSQLTCRWTGYQPNLFYATIGDVETRRLVDSQTPISMPLDQRPIYEFVDGPLEAKSYREMYRPLNLVLYRKQIHFFEEYLKLAKSHDIKVFLVVMPMRAENTALLSAEFKNQFKADVARLARQYNGVLVDPGSECKYFGSDFEGFAHLNSQGGTKLYRSIVEAFVRNGEH